MNNDLISREALKKQVQELLDLAGKRVDDTPNNNPCYRMYVEQENERTRFIKLIDNAPTVELFCSYLSDGEVRQPCVEAPCKHERPQGEWIFEKADNERTDGYICSNCGCSYHTKVPYFSEYNFCPNCGADMRKGGAE